MPNDSSRLTQAFWKKVNKDGPIPKARPELGPCWIWVGAKDDSGYGTFAGRGAHRQVMGNPTGFDVHHKCFNPSCVRDSHLQVITPEAHRTIVNPFKRKRSQCMLFLDEDVSGAFWHSEDHNALINELLRMHFGSNPMATSSIYVIKGGHKLGMNNHCPACHGEPLQQTEMAHAYCLNGHLLTVQGRCLVRGCSDSTQ